MVESEQVVVPTAIYFDANALIAAPSNFAAQPIVEAFEIAKLLGAEMLIPELAVEEWLSHRCDLALRAIAKIEKNMKQVGTLMDRPSLEWERISNEEVQESVRAGHEKWLINAGFQVIPTPPIELTQLVKLFLTKTPPFNDGDKGFKDAIILETIFQHTCRDNAFEHAVIVSSDAVFMHPSVRSRFYEAGTTIHVVGGKPQDLFRNLSEQLKTTLSEAHLAVMKQKRSVAYEFAGKHEPDVLRFVMNHAKISRSDVVGFGLSSLGRQKDENDEKLRHARIVSIDAIRPLRVKSAYAAPDFPREPADGRVPFWITVALEIDLTIAVPDRFNEPRVPIDSASRLLEGQLAWGFPERRESITVKREITVFGSVAAEGANSDEFQDLRLEAA